jgi:hypothetical protein
MDRSSGGEEVIIYTLKTARIIFQMKELKNIIIRNNNYDTDGKS